MKYVGEYSDDGVSGEPDDVDDPLCVDVPELVFRGGGRGSGDRVVDEPMIADLRYQIDRLQACYLVGKGVIV